MKSRSTKKIMCGVLTAALVLGMSVPSVAAKKAKLGFTKANLLVGQKKKITIKNKKKGAKYTYKSSAVKKAAVSKSGVISANKVGKAKITVKETYKKKTVKCGTINVTIKNKKEPEATPIVTISPTLAPVPTAVATAIPVRYIPTQNPTEKPAEGTSAPEVTAGPTSEPTAEPTPDVYTKEVLTLDVTETKVESVKGNTCDVDMQFFKAEAASDYFNGSTVAESTTTIKDYHEGYKDGTAYTSARYVLKGTDNEGKETKIFIEDNGIKNEDGTITSTPIIFTDSKSLTWLETADLQSRVVDSEDGHKTVHIMWNESNTEPIKPGPVFRPEMTKKYDKELFVFQIDIGGSDEVNGTNGKGSMIHFGGKAVGDSFTGKIVSDCTDTRKQFNGQVQSLSARYIIEGQDSNGNACRVFVDNIGIDENSTMTTEPTIISDNPDFAWIEEAPLHGTVSWDGGLHIHMWTTSD